MVEENAAGKAGQKTVLQTANETEQLLVSATKTTALSILDATKRKTALVVLNELGRKLKQQAHIPYMPDRLVNMLETMVDQTWAELCPELVDMVAAPTLSSSQSDVFLLNWANAFPPFWAPGAALPQPYTWLRAIFLYYQIHADVTKWKVARSPIFWTIEGLKLYPVTAVPMFVLYFLFIEKHDEHQLVWFIRKAKVFACLTSGLAPAFSLASQAPPAGFTRNLYAGPKRRGPPNAISP